MQKTKNHLSRLIVLISTVASLFCARAQTFTGTNSPGSATDFSVQIGAGVTNLALTVGGSASAFSHILLKSGATATDSSYDFISQLDGQTNTLNIEVPELAAPSTYYIHVRTPSNSVTHAFTLLVETNRTDVRTLRAASKPLVTTLTGVVAAGTWNYYRVEIPTNSSGWRALLDSAGTVDLYLQKSQLPTTSTYLKRSTGLTNDVVSLSDSEVQPGASFFGVFATATTNYFFRTENVSVTPINFDAGVTADGTDVYTNSNVAAGDFYFKIRTTSPALGAWRTALKVLAGEADLYMSRGVLPSTSVYDFKSDRIGSDGVVLGSSQFSAAQDWYILVHAAANSQWTLVSGAPYVMDLGVLATDASSGSGNVTIGPEGFAFFQTSIPATALAWRLGIGPGKTNGIYLKKTGVPLPISNELTQQGQMLVVPPYLQVNQLYFVGVVGAPGTIINLDSRVQPIADLDLSSSTNQVVTDFGYTTYRVQVPSLIAWEVNVSASSGNPNVAVRRSLVPNENYNDGYSENPGTIGNSISLVPLALANGTWFITVYGTNTTLAFTVQNGQPVVTDINYSGVVTNDNPSKVGWRYYRVADLAQQSGTLGWDLYLTNYTPGTRIALRRTSVPSIWSYRSPNVTAQNNYDLLSTADFLQQPAHQADIWYIGVYNPTNALGAFSLVTRELPATDLQGDGDLISRTNVPNGKWEFFRLKMDVTGGGTNPPVLGWDVRLQNVATSSLPRIIVRRDGFPTSTTTTLTSPATATNWQSGQQWAPTYDWSRHQFSPDGSIDEYGRVFQAGAGRPLESATYYVGIVNTTGTNSMTYTLSSRFIGNGYSLPITELPYSGGALTNNSLNPREAAYYHVTVPSGVRSWKVRLTTTSGEAMLVVSTNKLPNIESEKRMQKTGKEHYVLLPSPGQTNLAAGDYYLAVVGEGSTITNASRISTGPCSYVLESLGAMQEIDMGVLDQDIYITDTLEGGESKAYHFEPIPGTLGYQVAFLDKTGNPVAVARSGNSLVDPGIGGTADTYGNEGGENQNYFTTQTITTVVDPQSIETLMVKARAVSNAYPNATYTIVISPYLPDTGGGTGGSGIDQIDFDGGYAQVAQDPNGWAYFRIDVPTNALGWNLRLVGVSGGSPKMVVERDHLPNSLSTSGVIPQGGTNWPSSGRWAAGADWTGRSQSYDGSVNEDGRILQMGMNRPLVPGTYYVGITSATGGGTMAYTIVSRGIGDGFYLPVQDLAFAGGSFTYSNVPVREAGYFRVQIPTNTPSWKVRLTTTAGEATLIALKDAVPNIAAGASFSVTNSTSPGRKMQKTNDEFYVLQPAPGQTTIPAGTYYLAAIAEGLNATNSTRIGVSNSTFTITSYGALPITDLGALTSDIYTNVTLGGGETVAFQFSVTNVIYGFDIRLENRTGNPVAVYRPGSRLPDPGVSVPGSAADSYGSEGGETTLVDGNGTLATYLNPTSGVYSVVIKARASNGTTPDATFTLHIDVSAPAGTIPLTFDGGIDTVTNQTTNTWRYYAVDVPPGALGWDIRLTNVTSGSPKMVVRRDVPPVSLSTTPWANPGSASTWATSNAWAAASDWTRRSSSALGTNEDGRVLAMGMGRPLEPGQYIIGITNAGGTTNALGYTIVSRGIGTGYSLPVVNIPFVGGSATGTVQPREAAYFSVVVPSNSPSWKMRLQVTSGEAMMVCLSNRVPNIDTYVANGTMANGKGMQKSGNEHYIMLPALGQTSIAPGTNYFAVIGEGANPLNSTRVGVGPSSFVIQSLGPVQTNDLGLLTSMDLEKDDSLESGETKAYQFAVPFETLGFEFRLESRVGNPVAMYRPGSSWPDPGAAMGSSLPAEPYGNEGGFTPTDGNAALITVPNPTPGVYSAVVKARASAGNFSDASYHLRVREILTPEINFGAYLNTNGLNNVVSGSLEDNQRAFFIVHVPATYNGAPVLGWKLDLQQTSGSASVRVRKDLLPSDSPVTGTPFTTAEAIIASPYLTNGTWYVEVKGSNSTSFTLTSNPLLVERPAWVMPAPSQTNTAPGLALPVFGDTGFDTNGVKLAGDQSIFLDQGYQHVYGFVVPTNNLGLVRVSLETSSGNPDAYLRYGSAPTVLHNASGAVGTLFDRSMTAANTEYANWVPIDGKLETALAPGTWYLMVRANGNASARYRLRLSTGDIQNLNISGDGLTNQTLLAGDWRYYRVQMPTSLPLGWNVTFSQQSGDVWMYIRDTIPPGQGATSTVYKDWGTDVKNNGPYGNYDPAGTYSFSAPAVRPGAVYYVGFRALSDSTFSVSVGTNGGPTLEPQTIAFYGGSISTNLPPFSQVTYRIDVPAEATRWKHSSIHSTNLQLSIEQGTVPYKSSNDDFRSSGTNSFLNQYLLTAWPWVPNQSYFLTVTNISANPEPLTFSMDGKNAITDDNDNDLLPDAWELAYFGGYGQNATGDYDGDGVANMDEFLEGTNPADNTSFRPRLVTSAANGTISRDVTMPSYAMGSTVTLTPIPNPGFTFVNWTGSASGTAVPYSLVMNGHKIVSALFKVIGDDFSTRVQLAGSSVTANGSNIGATKEPGEPNHAGNPGGKSVWWTWSPTSGGPVTISTAGSTFNTVLAVYTGSSVSNLTLVASDNNSLGGTNRSRVTFTPDPCATYEIAVDGLWAASGYITLSISQAPTTLQITGPAKNAGGFQFNVQGDANQVYTVESSTDLVNWTQLGFVTNGCGTAMPVIDTSATNATKRFYRFHTP
jgi:large repetitive protein